MQVRDNITSWWSFLNLCRFNDSGYMLSPTGQSSRNTDSPQRNQPSVAPTSWSREWNRAQGELFSLFILDTHVHNTAHPALVWAVSFCYSLLHWRACFCFCCLLAFRHVEVSKFNTNHCLRFLFLFSSICHFSHTIFCPFKKKRLKRSCWKKIVFFRLWVFGVIAMFLMVFPNRMSRYTGTGTI